MPRQKRPENFVFLIAPLFISKLIGISLMKQNQSGRITLVHTDGSEESHDCPSLDLSEFDDILQAVEVFKSTMKEGKTENEPIPRMG